jgi:hypothetical protein
MNAARSCSETPWRSPWPWISMTASLDSDDPAWLFAYLHGCGMPAAGMRRRFSAFRQQHGVTTRRRPARAASPCHWTVAALRLLLSRALSSATARSRVPWPCHLRKKSQKGWMGWKVRKPIRRCSTHRQDGVVRLPYPCYWRKATNLRGLGTASPTIAVHETWMSRESTRRPDDCAYSCSFGVDICNVIREVQSAATLR